MTLSEKLKELRIAYGYKQVDIASVLGIVRQTYSHYERGDRTPNTETLYRIAAFYNISLNELLKDTIELDPELYYTAPKGEFEPNDKSLLREPQTVISQKSERLSASEQELIFYFKKIGTEEQKVLMDTARLFAKNMGKN